MPRRPTTTKLQRGPLSELPRHCGPRPNRPVFFRSALVSVFAIGVGNQRNPLRTS
jgi:hypothetical protein